MAKKNSKLITQNGINSFLTEENFNHVKLISKQILHKNLYNYRSFTKEDLASEGVIGLINAAKNYDPKYNTKFKTYSEYRIKGAILDFIRKESFYPRSFSGPKPELLSLDDLGYEKEDTSNVEEIYDRKTLILQINEHLDEKEKLIVSKLLEEKTYLEIAQDLKVSESRICQIIKNINEKLRKKMKENPTL